MYQCNYIKMCAVQKFSKGNVTIIVTVIWLGRVELLQNRCVVMGGWGSHYNVCNFVLGNLMLVEFSGGDQTVTRCSRGVGR